MLRVARIALVAVASAFIGCAGSGGGGGGGGKPPCPCKPPVPLTVTLPSNIQPIFNVSCALAGCHLGATPAQGLDLSTGKTYGSIVNVKSTEIPKLFMVCPGNPDNSYVVQKIEGTPGIGGIQMPQGCPGSPLGGAQCLSANDIAAIRQWITECATPNN